MMNSSFNQLSAIRSSLGTQTPHGVTTPATKSTGKMFPRISSASAMSSLSPQSGAGAHDQLVKQTQNWVAQTFFGTMLKQMRDSPFKSEMFDGGRGGQAFASMYDQHLAQKMARGAGKKLVNSLVRKIESKKAKASENAAGAAAVKPVNASQTNADAGQHQQKDQQQSPPSARWRANLSKSQVDQLSTGLTHVATAR